MISTKITYEVSPGKFLSVAFGNIAESDADLVCISAFSTIKNYKHSSFGAIQEKLMQENINLMTITGENLPSFFNLFKIRERKDDKGFKYLGIFSNGQFKNRNALNQVMQNYLLGFSESIRVIQEYSDINQIDITALGNRSTQIERRELIIKTLEWITYLFQKTAIRHIRFVLFEQEAFIDFFVSLYNLKMLDNSKELIITSSIEKEKYSEFDKDLISAFESIEKNPSNTIGLCRKIIEKTLNNLIDKLNIPKKKNANLSSSIQSLSTYIPEHIFSYMELCRKFGNIAVHQANTPFSVKDAETVMILTLRIIDWYLEEYI